jgi:hypothetical protein
LRGQEFEFELFHRPVPLGDHGTARYYWIDSSQSRRKLSKTSIDNARNCVEHSRTAISVSGCDQELEQEIHYVLVTRRARTPRSAIGSASRTFVWPRDRDSSEFRPSPECFEHQ